MQMLVVYSTNIFRIFTYYTSILHSACFSFIILRGSTKLLTAKIIRSDNLRSQVIYQLSGKINSVAGRQAGGRQCVLLGDS